MQAAVILFSFVGICMNYVDGINYENLIIYVSGLSWSLTIIQGGYDKFWDFVSRNIVGKIIETLMKNHLNDLNLAGMRDEDGYVVTSEDVRKLGLLLANKGKELFAIRSKSRVYINRENTSRESGSVVFTKYVAVVSVLVAIELATGISSTLGIGNLYVFIPLLYLYHQTYDTIKKVTAPFCSYSARKEKYAMGLWMTYKRAVL